MAENFRDMNRRRRERNAFENYYAYARKAEIPDPKRTAERAAQRVHLRGVSDAEPSRDAASSQSDVPHRLDDRTKEQLYERARELDVQGRSQMTKEELVDAIRAQS